AFERDDLEMVALVRSILPATEDSRAQFLVEALQSKHLEFIDEYPKHYAEHAIVLSSLDAYKMLSHDWTDADVGKLLSFFDFNTTHLRTELTLALHARCDEYVAYLLRELKAPSNIPAFVVSCMQREKN